MWQRQLNHQHQHWVGGEVKVETSIPWQGAAIVGHRGLLESTYACLSSSVVTTPSSATTLAATASTNFSIFGEHIFQV
jgi:hypothetical protein